MEGGGGGGVGKLLEVGGEHERVMRAARDPPVQEPGPQGGEATGQGAGDDRGQVQEDAGRGPPVVGPGQSKKRGEKAKGTDAEGAAGEGGVVLKRAGDREPARRAADRRGSVQGHMMNSIDHNQCRDEGRRRKMLRGAAASWVAQ